MTPNLLSVDVEDWFHILDLPSTPPLSQWNSLESRVERNFHRLLDEFDARSVKTTCFFLGWVAQRFPQLVREACARGHEIASHGWRHALVYEQTRPEFREDAAKTKALLEDIGGAPVRGYRAAGFSIRQDSLWALEELAAAGYKYDSSVFPAPRGHGGLPGGRRDPHWIETPQGRLFEFPISVAGVAGRPVCFFGGGYLRLFPYAVTKRMAERVNAEGRPVVYYVHPREIDPGHPRLPMGLARRFKSYVNLDSTLGKLRAIMQEQTLTTFSEWLARTKAPPG